MAKKSANQSVAPERAARARRVQVSQKEIPANPLSQALRVPMAIKDNYGSQPSSPLKVAQALDMQPNAGTFRNLCGSAVAYGLIDGGAYSDEIAISALGRRILKPTTEGDDKRATTEAFLTPRVIGEFLRKYNGSPIPKDEIAGNVLEEMGVPPQRTSDAFELILQGAQSLGLLREIKGRKYVDLGADLAAPPPDESAGEPPDASTERHSPETENRIKPKREDEAIEPQIDVRLGRVFITHGKNKTFIDPIKRLLQFGMLEAVVAEEHQSVAQPVPDKVMTDMRSCGAAIIHVDAEMKLIDENAKEIVMLNPNVLIEIGAAMALYGRRFILLVKEGINLPSNLQGLYEVRYAGDNLDSNSTIRLLEAINDIKNHALP